MVFITVLRPDYAPRLDRLPSPSQYLTNKAHDKEMRTSLSMATAGEPAVEQGPVTTGVVGGGYGAGSFSPHVRSGRHVQSDTIEQLWDREMMWSEWRGELVGNSFLDEHGFLVPLGHAHDWQVAHSHWMCLQHRSRPKWIDVIMTAAQYNAAICDVMDNPATVCNQICLGFAKCV